LGGEELKFFRVLLAAVVIAAGVFSSGLTTVSAQTPDQPGPGGQTGPALSGEDIPAVPDPSEESRFVLGETPADTPGQGAVSFFIILRMVVVLALAAGLIYVVVFLLKRITRPSEQVNPHLKILSSAYLGSNRYVHVVSAGSKAWLLGACDGGVTLIAEVTDREAVDAMLLDDSRKKAEGGATRLLDFSSLMRRFGGAGNKGGPSPENIRKRRERLKGL
jgi:flagellar protein FliO/FliZ